MTDPCPHLEHGRRRRDGKCAIDKEWRGKDCKENRPPAPCVLPCEHPLYCAEEECPRDMLKSGGKVCHGYRRSQKDIDLRSHAIQEGVLVGVKLGHNAVVDRDGE